MKDGLANLLVKDGLGLTTITGLLPVVTPLSCQKYEDTLLNMLRAHVKLELQRSR